MDIKSYALDQRYFRSSSMEGRHVNKTEYDAVSNEAYKNENKALFDEIFDG